MSRIAVLLLGLLLALAALLVFKPHRRHLADPAAPITEAGPGAMTGKPIHSLRRLEYAGGEQYLVRNLAKGPIEVRCAFASAHNVISDPALPRRLIIAAEGELKLTELRSIAPGQEATAAIECQAMVGDPRAVIAKNIDYAIPFHPGTEFTVDQGFNGAYSHRNPQSRYAVDFGLAEGTPVLLARGGVIMQVEEDFLAGGNDAERFGDRANYVRVLHDDGSMAVYAHLAPHSVILDPGDRVQAGSQIGRSGNTGFSTGPHLHFCVQTNVGLALHSVPFNMPGVDPWHGRH